MKKKILAIAIAAIMVLTAVASVSLAYLTDTDEQDNVFTIGNVKIQQIEYERVKDANGNKTSELKLFTNSQKVYPAVYGLPTDPARSNLTVNGGTISIRNFPNYIDKIVTVGNIGNSDAYVRVIVAIPVSPNEEAEDGDVSENWIHTNHVPDGFGGNGWYHGKDSSVAYPAYEDRYVVENVTINGKLYDLEVYTNINKIAPLTETAPCFAGFYLDNDLNYEDDPEDGTGDGWYMPYGDEDGRYYVISADEVNEEGLAENLILVATQAVQTEGFADAWQAFAASFGEITDTNHPWYTPEEQN